MLGGLRGWPREHRGDGGPRTGPRLPAQITGGRAVVGGQDTLYLSDSRTNRQHVRLLESISQFSNRPIPGIFSDLTFL